MTESFRSHSNDEVVESIATFTGGLLLPLLPVIFALLAYFDVITFGVFKVSLSIFFFLFVIFPIIYKYSYTLQRYAVFLTFVHVPLNADYKNPQNYGLKNSRNFYISTDDGVDLGVWQILPENASQINDDNDELSFQKVINNGQDIIIYSHGNGGTRLSSHRIEMYQVLRKYFHVFALDYRGYGDSTRASPSESAVVNDVLTVYQWIRNRTKSNIFIWGHSLGTSISSHVVLKIQNLSIERPLGLILESPFNNMRDEVGEFPLAQLFKHLPWFGVTVVGPMAKNFPFTTDKYICGINIPIMILHAEDDKVVPFKLGHKLYKSAKECRLDHQGDILFHSFDGKYQFGHKYICRATDLPDKISDFVNYAYETKNKNKLQY